jgi:mRNA-degrading endonuclease RelE of RelBE toxin-antitoxin system
VTPLRRRLTGHAERDLLRLPDALRQRVKQDIVSLSTGQLPLAQLKKLQGFFPPVWQLTSGRYRVFYRRAGEELLILRVVPKAAQRKTFRGMR